MTQPTSKQDLKTGDVSGQAAAGETVIQIGDVHGGQITIALGAQAAAALDGPDYGAARARYLAALRRRYGAAETHAYTALAQDDQVGRPRRLDLLGEKGVYVPLFFDAPAARREPGADEPGKEAHLREMAERELRPLALADVLQLPGHLAIVGDAGCGKTTVLHVVVSALAAENPQAIAPDLAPILPHPRPIPVFLPLRLFAHACTGGYAPAVYNHCAADLLRFVDDWFGQWCPSADLPPNFLSAHVQTGRAWLLLDALDEVANPRHRENVRHVIHDLADQLHSTRLIVTARLAAYRDVSLENFAVATVRDLDEEQRTQMVHAIYRGLALDDPDRYAADLDGLFRSSQALRDLTRTPVMVWTAAVIHALRGKLPEGRAALYDAYVDILLKKSFEHARDDTAPLEELVGGQDFSLQDRRHYLSYAAFQVHGLLEAHPERRPGREEERAILVGEDELVDEVLAPYFQDKMYLADDPREARERAQTFVALMVERSGLLYETPQGYTIGDHLTMQEFLAGCYLGDDYRLDDAQGYAGFVRDKVSHSWWREVFLLAAGYLAEKGFKAPKFLEEIARQGDKSDERLAALSLAGRGLLQLQAHVQRPTWYAGLAQKLAGQLYSLLHAEQISAPVTARQEAGLVLGLLYGYPGEDGLTDPRFVAPLGLPAFVPIEGGWFWMGSTEEEVKLLIEKEGNDYFSRELPRHRVHLSPYEIAHYPTTNGMFAHFIGAGGYADERWWPEAIAAGHWKDGKVKDWYSEDWFDLPRYWDDPKWNNPSQPVVGVSWYEAAAYCRWLTAALADGYEYRLPSEAQWERAARGSRSLLGGSPSPSQGEGTGVGVYPWGDDWRDDHCNSQEAGLSVTSPVGIFPQGAAEGTIHDLAGNVWEWCWDWYGEDYYADSQDARDPTGPGQGQYRVLRGGSWASEGSSRCRCGYRYWRLPWYGNYLRGFRCVRTLSS